jgi:Tfp pilus assembly PilM family ATPase
MPNYLALEWGRAGIRGLDAEVSGDVVQIRSSFTHAWPAELGVSNDPEGVGLWLKSQLQELGAGDRRLMVLVSREDAAMRLLALPEASDEALPDLVRYQMGARSSVPLDQLAFDYLPLISSAPQGGRQVQTASVPNRLLQHIKTCAEVAGLDLRFVGVTTVAFGEAITRAELARGLSVDRKRLVVCVVGEQLEVALWRGNDLLFSHVSRAADSDTVLVEVQRALMSHESVAGKDAIARVWLIAPPESKAELQNTLANRLSCDVVVFEPLRDVQAAGLTGDVGAYVASLGALLASGQSTIPAIDFLNPRRRVAKPVRTKTIAVVAVGVLLLLLTTAYLTSRLYLSSLDGRIAEKENSIRKQDEYLRQGEPTRETMAVLSSWESRQVDFLEQMKRIGAELPGTQRVYLESWRFDLATGEALATTEATGFARERQDAERATQRLAEQAGFRVRPNPIGTAGSDPEYPILFQLDAEMVFQSRRPVRNESE